MGALGLAFRAIVHYSANMSAQCAAPLWPAWDSNPRWVETSQGVRAGSRSGRAATQHLPSNRPSHHSISVSQDRFAWCETPGSRVQLVASTALRQKDDLSRIDANPDTASALEHRGRWRRGPQLQVATTGCHQVIPRFAEVDALRDRAFQDPARGIAGSLGPQRNALRAHREHIAPIRLTVAEEPGVGQDPVKADRAVRERSLEEIGPADEAGDEARPRPVIELVRRSD